MILAFGPPVAHPGYPRPFSLSPTRMWTPSRPSKPFLNRFIRFSLIGPSPDLQRLTPGRAFALLIPPSPHGVPRLSSRYWGTSARDQLRSFHQRRLCFSLRLHVGRWTSGHATFFRSSLAGSSHDRPMRLPWSWPFACCGRNGGRPGGCAFRIRCTHGRLVRRLACPECAPHSDSRPSL